MTFRDETRVAIDAVTRAFDIARRSVGAADISEKGERDIVTVVDVAVEDMLRRSVGTFPVVGEERGGQAPADGSPYWLTDPICGTRNFASGVPLFCVNLALVEGGEVTAAVVGHPSTGEIDVAERGRGAWALEAAGPRRLTTSETNQTVVIEDGKAKGALRERAAQFITAAVRADAWDLRSLGTTIGLPYVASGRMAAYMCFLVSSTHTAAGSLLVTEAGGTATDIDGNPWTVDSCSIVCCANANLHERLLGMRRSGS